MLPLVVLRPIDSAFDGEPEVTVDHSAPSPDAVDFMAIAKGGGAAYVVHTTEH